MMSTYLMTTITALAFAAALTGPARADSLASSASSAGSASSASVSDSIQESSAASRGGKVAAGAYRIVAIAPAAAGRQRVELQSVQDPARRFALVLPVAAAPLAAGEVIEVQDRPFGYAFARGPARETFFVALAEGWQQDLDLKAVTL
jgi:hypothetical protein